VALNTFCLSESHQEISLPATSRSEARRQMEEAYGLGWTILDGPCP
jgi:hypothetical protein